MNKEADTDDPIVPIQSLLEVRGGKSKVRSERANLIKFFIENVLDRKGNQYKPSFIAMRLSHIPTKDLYYSVSIYKDTLQRRGREAADKEFWWSIKAH